ATKESEVIGEFGAALDPIHRGIGLAAEVSETGDIHTNLIAAGELRETEMQAATGELEAEFVEGGGASRSVVLKGDVEVAGLVEAGARAGVLAEHLVLRCGREAGGERRRNTNADKGVVAVAPALIEAGRPKAGLLGNGIIATRRRQCRE